MKIKKRMSKVASDYFEVPIKEVIFEDELIKSGLSILEKSIGQLQQA